jgi:hypothetical protein
MKRCSLERMNDFTHTQALRIDQFCSLICTWTDSHTVTIIMTVYKLDQWGVYCYISHYQTQLMLKGSFCTACNLHVHQEIATLWKIFYFQYYLLKNVSVIWDIKLCSPLKVNWHFEWTCHFQLPPKQETGLKHVADISWHSTDYLVLYSRR